MRDRIHTRRYQDHGVIGWISTTDAMLLGMSLMFTLAMFIQTKYMRTDKERIALASENQNLKADLDSKTKRLDELLAQVAKAGGLNLLDELNAQIEKLKAEKAKLEQQNLALAGRNREIEAELQKVNDELSRKTMELAKAQQRIDEVSTLMADIQKQLDEQVKLNAELKKELASLGTKADTLEGIVQRARDYSIKPLANAALVVRLRCEKPPEWLDLDLYVQDPMNKICGYTRPRILDDNAETGLLIPSEAIITLDGSTEEMFTSIRAITGGPENPYLVFCMLRENGKTKAPEQFEIEVECRVEIQRNGKLEGVDTRKLKLNQKGALFVKKGKYVYPGLTPVCAFEVVNDLDFNDFRDIRPIPELPRGWIPTEVVGKPAIKARD